MNIQSILALLPFPSSLHLIPTVKCCTSKLNPWKSTICSTTFQLSWANASHTTGWNLLTSLETSKIIYALARMFILCKINHTMGNQQIFRIFNEMTKNRTREPIGLYKYWLDECILTLSIFHEYKHSFMLQSFYRLYFNCCKRKVFNEVNKSFQKNC